MDWKKALLRVAAIFRELPIEIDWAIVAGAGMI